MPVYTYTALNAQGVRLTGDVVAETEEIVRADLAGRGLLVQEIKQKYSAIWFRSNRISLEEFALFNQEFMALIRAGLTIPDALVLSSNRPDSPALGRILTRVLEDIHGGALLSDACSQHPEAFERLYLAALHTGEKTGDLANVLARYHDYLKHRVALRKKLGQAMAYPVFLLVVLAVILAVLFLFVMPRFVSMYADLAAELPLPTRALLGVVQHMYIIAPLCVAGLATSVIGWRHWNSTTTGRRKIDQIKERIPYVGTLSRIVITAQLARSLSTLLAGGTPLVEALRTTSSSITNQVYLDRLNKVTQQIIEGSALAQSVRTEGLMPEMASRMIEVGEASGGLDTMLAEIAMFYEEMLDTRLSRVMSLVEPMLMLLMGLLIGGIIIVMYLPVFHLADIIK
jgi:type IV pilus assembly protein PilC